MTDLPTPDKPNIDYKSKTPMLLASLPDYVKDPKNYMKIERALLETLSCPKGHSDPASMMKCMTCSDNMVKRRNLMKKFGFTTAAHYMAWKKIHQEIKERVPLDKYNEMINESN